MNRTPAARLSFRRVSKTLATPGGGSHDAADMDTETLLLEARPSWWDFFWHLVFFFLIVPVIIAWVRRHSLVLRVYEDRVSLERGFLSKQVSDVFIVDIRDIQ